MNETWKRYIVSYWDNNPNDPGGCNVHVVAKSESDARSGVEDWGADVLGVRCESLFVRCRVCGKDMTERVNNKTGGRFMGCTGYPECKETESIVNE